MHYYLPNGPILIFFICPTQNALIPIQGLIPIWSPLPKYILQPPSNDDL